MPEIQSVLQCVRFGAFEADLRTGELRKDGVKLKFSGQPFQVLAILLERPGEVVTREELQKRLWPETFVDVEHNLNTAVNKIRDVLGDSAENPRFVETLPRRGYRFIGGLNLPAPLAVPTVPAEPARNPSRRRGWLKIGAGVLAVLVMALTAVIAHRWQRGQRSPEQAVLTAVPFTALPGRAANPAFSPDGSRIAFMWAARRDANGSYQSDLYVKTLGSETLLRLTQRPSTALTPVWSPDGTQIAFYRRAGVDSGIYLIPALGGVEQKLRSTHDLEFSAISWSPDGKWIAFEDVTPQGRERIYLISPETLAVKPIPINLACLEERLPAFSHNGNYLAYWCFQNDVQASLYFLSFPDGNPQLITRFWERFPTGLTWSANDKKLIYSRWRGSFFLAELREVSFPGGSVTKLGLQGMSPAVSRTGDKLAYGAPLFTNVLWRRNLLQRGLPAGEVVPSSRPQFDAQYSPDGKRIVFASQRSGVLGVWLSNEDGSNLVQISDPNYVSGSPQWSPDESKVAFDSFHDDHFEIYVADVAERKPRKLATNIRYVIRPSWSRDGKWIYFASQEFGREGVYRCPFSGGDATRLSQDINAFNPKESFDRKAVYFVSGATLKKVALPGQPGSESDVNPSLRVSRSQNWELTSTGIYFVPAEAPTSVRFFEFATRRIRTIFKSDHLLQSGLSISPDGLWILYSQKNDLSSDIMLVNNYR